MAQGQEMYGFPRLREAMATDDAGSALAGPDAGQLPCLHGPGCRAGDDVSSVTLRRTGAGEGAWSEARTEIPVTRDKVPTPERRRFRRRGEHILAFSIESAIGNERAAMQRVAEAVAPLGLEPARLERLKTAVAETVMNAIEYGSQGDPFVPVDVRVDANNKTIRVRVTDRALSGPVPDAEMPDLDAKLEGKQKPRGWGLFLIRHMVDGMGTAAPTGTRALVASCTSRRTGR